MTIKVSILIEKNLQDSLVLYQAEMIKKTRKSVSFSSAVNSVIQEGLKAIDSKSSRDDYIS